MKPTAQRRRDRRTLLDNLLGRMLRGRLSAAEAALLAESVREEQRAYDQTRRSLGETGEDLRKNREAAVQEQEERAKQAEKQLAGYVAVFGPHVVDDFHAMQHRAKQAEAALGRVRDAQCLGEALAAVAEYDGLTPEAARANAAFVEAADSTRARLDEQAREYEIKLAEERRRGDGWRRHALAADHRADRYRLAWTAARRDRRADRAAMAAELPLVQTGRMALTLSGLTTAEAVANVRQWAAGGIRAVKLEQRR